MFEINYNVHQLHSERCIVRDRQCRDVIGGSFTGHVHGLWLNGASKAYGYY